MQMLIEWLFYRLTQSGCNRGLDGWASMVENALEYHKIQTS